MAVQRQDLRPESYCTRQSNAISSV
jgi:hypothetical protein